MRSPGARKNAPVDYIDCQSGGFSPSLHGAWWQPPLKVVTRGYSASSWSISAGVASANNEFAVLLSWVPNEDLVLLQETHGHSFDFLGVWTIRPLLRRTASRPLLRRIQNSFSASALL